MPPTPLESARLVDDSKRFEQLRTLLCKHRLLPLLPLIYVAWANGELIDEELQTLREIADRQPWLDEEALQILQHWLDPDDPPEPMELQGLLQVIKEAGDALGEPERLSLAELGVQMGQYYRREADDDAERNVLSSDEVEAAMQDLEESLGLVGTEAARQLRDTVAAPAPPEPEVPSGAPTFDPQQMKQILDGTHHDLRDRVRTLLASDDFEFVYDLPLSDYRDQVLQWLETLADQGFGTLCFPEPDESGHRDLGEFLALFETLGLFDLSLLVKFGVQFGLFGGSIMFLGTEKHHQTYLDRVASLDLLGCYAMTEMGHGSNVRQLGTVARYDDDADEFVIHTPTESARKEWIGGAGEHATMATVYAQLHIGDEHYGVHAFLVPIRDDDGEVLPGVRIEDQGPKMGLNGVDNGRIWFDHVRIPRHNLLDRYGGVYEDGTYHSSTPSADRRFFTMLGTLVAGRLGISAAGITAAKTALAIATRYSHRRRQFGPAGQPEIPILDYRMHQRALLPKIAGCYALTFGLHEVMHRYNDPEDEDRRRTEALAAGLKAYSSWFAIDAVQTAREGCGGQGYLTLNRLPSLRTDVDVFATFEGANVVMMQQVARGCLSDFHGEVGDGNIFTLARMIARQSTRTLTEANPVASRNTDTAHLLSTEFQLNALSYRRHNLLVSLARRLKRRIDEGMDSFLAFNDCQDHAVALANADIEHFLLQSFIDAEQRCNDDELRETLQLLRNLFALYRIEQDGAWFMENNYLQTPKFRAIRDQVNALCETARDQAIPMVDAFGIPDECLSAPIAFADDKAPADSRRQFARGAVGEES